MMIGFHIVTVIGRGARLMVGPGLATNRGVGRRITSDGGSITTIDGRGVHAAGTTGIEVGGDLPSSRFIFRSAMIIAGIRFITTSVIHTLVIIVTPLLSD